MKAWRVYGYRDMRLDDIPEPVVRAGWVKAKIRVVQPSITETLLFAGIETYGYSKIAAALRHAPVQLFGHEFSAEIVEVGEGVTLLAQGMRVAARGSHPEGIVGFDYPGAIAEYGLFPETLLMPIPSHVSDSEAAAIQPLTDAVAAVDAARIRPGDVVVVIGQGSMGLSSLQVAASAGAAQVIAVARRDAVLDLSSSLGATVVINSTRTDPVDAVLELTGGRGADVIFETAGGPPAQGLSGDATLHQAARMVRDEGTIVGISYDGNGAYLPYEPFRTRSLRYVFPSLLNRQLFQRTVDLVASGEVRLKPLITCLLDGIERVPDAFALTADKAANGLINPAQVVISAR